MEVDLSSKVVGKYVGNLVYTHSQKVVRTAVEVVRLNNLLIKVSFKLDLQEYVFRGILSEQNEGLLLIVENKVSLNYLVSGISGFLPDKPNVHGGLLNNLKSFYFHIDIKEFKGASFEAYFMGKDEVLVAQKEQSRMHQFSAK